MSTYVKKTELKYEALAMKERIMLRNIAPSRNWCDLKITNISAFNTWVSKLRASTLQHTIAVALSSASMSSLKACSTEELMLIMRECNNIIKARKSKEK